MTAFPLSPLLWRLLSNEASAIADQIRQGQELTTRRPNMDDLASLISEYAPIVSASFLANIASSDIPGTCILVRNSLLKYLIAQTLRSEGVTTLLLRANLPSIPSARERLVFIDALARLIAALTNPCDGNSRRTQVDAAEVVSLLSTLAHRKFAVPSAVDVEGALSSFAAVEPALYLWRDAYRDHLFHATDVCILGWFLLECRLLGTDKTFADAVAAMMGTTKPIMYANWFLAALLHDIGYAMDAISQACKQVAYLKSPPLDILQENIRTARRTISASIENEFLKDLPPEQVDGLDHGVVAFLYLKEILKKAIPDSNARAKFKPACQAIRKHNLRVPVSFVSEPLTFLLILCDVLQEWERPRVSSRAFAARAREVLEGIDEGPLPSATILESVNLEGLRCVGDVFQLTGDSLKCHLMYKPPEEGKFRPQVVCLEKCHNLQRLNPEGLPFSIEIEMVNQFLDTTSREYGLEEFRNYALRNRSQGLVDWAEGRRDGIQVINFSTHPLTNSIEYVSFDLATLNRFPLLPPELDFDWDDFNSWSLTRPDPYGLAPPPLLRPDSLSDR